jgi:hypothetical protein
MTETAVIIDQYLVEKVFKFSVDMPRVRLRMSVLAGYGIGLKGYKRLLVNF